MLPAELAVLEAEAKAAVCRAEAARSNLLIREERIRIISMGQKSERGGKAAVYKKGKGKKK